jgi:phosphatidate cytidylyltransferase
VDEVLSADEVDEVLSADEVDEVLSADEADEPVPVVIEEVDGIPVAGEGEPAGGEMVEDDATSAANPDDLAAALDALGAEQHQVEVIDAAEVEEIGDPEPVDFDALSALADGLGDPSPEEAAARSEYGVAGPEAFDALRALDEPADDLSEWEDFAGIPTAAAESPPMHAEPIGGADLPGVDDVTDDGQEADDDFDEEAVAAERPRRGIWPFRRRVEADEPEADEALEESAEWQDDGTAIPAQWFADIDEDAVVAPPAHLPETEWPVADRDQPGAGRDEVEDQTADEEPAAAMESPGEYEPGSEPPVEISLFDEPGPAGEALPPSAAAADEVVEDVIAAAGDQVWDSTDERAAAPAEDGWEPQASESPPEWDADEGPVPTPTATDLSADDSAERESAPPEPAPGWEPDEGAIPDSGMAGVEPRGEEWAVPAAEGDELLPDRLELGFNDGTGETDPVRRHAFDDEDVDEGDWVTGPIDVGDAYDDEPTEVLPTDNAALEHLSDAIFRTSATTEHRGLAEEIVLAGEEEREWQAISAAMPGVETGVVGFDDVADLGTEDEYYEPRLPSDIGTRVLTGVVLAGFFLGSLWVAPEALAGFIGIILLLGMGELFATVRRRGLRPLSLFGFLGGIAMLATAWFHGPVAIPATLAITSVVTFFVYAFSPLRGDALTNGGLTVLGLGWVVGTAAFAYPILASEDYRILVLAIVGVTAAMDIGAFAVGRAWGSRALAPVLSPNKSVEGLVGGVGVCMLAAAAVGSFLEPFDLMSGIGLGIVVAIAAPLGDLAESMLKRSLGVKDMGSILPGHGGILDRIDALLFVIPAAWVFYLFVGLLG